MQFLVQVIFLTIIILNASPVCATEEKLDSLALASKLMKSSEYDKATEALKQVDDKQKKGEAAKFYTVSGLIKLYQKKFELAERAFITAQKSNPSDRYIYIYLAQAYFGQEKYQETIDTLAKVNELASGITSMHIIKANALWNLKKYEKAWKQADAGLLRFPDEFRLHRLKINWLAEKQLFSQIHAYASTLIENKNIQITDLISIAGLLRSHNQIDLAISYLELLRLVNSSDEVTTQLALSYAKKGDFTNAAILFEQNAALNPEYYYEAAELYARAGNHQYALSLNGKVIDQKKKFKQRLTILLSQGDFESAVSSEDDMIRLGLLDQEEISYALAYAFYRIRDFEKAEYYLIPIKSNELFQKAIALRKEILSCKSIDGSCSA